MTAKKEPTLDDLVKQHKSVGVALRQYALKSRQTAVPDRKATPAPAAPPRPPRRKSAPPPPSPRPQGKNPVPPQLKKFLFKKGQGR